MMTLVEKLKAIMFELDKSNSLQAVIHRDDLELMISQAERNEDESLKYLALEHTGVDNWSGWEDALELYEEYKS